MKTKLFSERRISRARSVQAARSCARALMICRAGTCFGNGHTPIERTRRTTLETEVRLDRLHQILRQCRADLTACNRQLKQEIAQRESAEESLKRSAQCYRQLLEESHQMQKQLRHLSHLHLLSLEEERTRIGRELHDVIAQTLTGVNLRLAALTKEAPLNTKDLERNIALTQKLVEHSVDIVHRFARELRPTILDDLGLVPALHTFLKSFREETGIEVTLSVFAALGRVKGDERTVLYRVAQEALTNIARHAQASRVEVRIEKLECAVCMKIEDNGKGFSAKRVQHAKKNKRLGLLGMRERVEMVGGSFTIESAPGKGTTIQAQIPLTDSRAGEVET